MQLRPNSLSGPLLCIDYEGLEWPGADVWTIRLDRDPAVVDKKGSVAILGWRIVWRDVDGGDGPVVA